MRELWKDIKGFEGYYQISNLGRCRSLDRYVNVCGGGKRLAKGKIITPCQCANGYLELMLSMGQKRKVILLHRAVAQAFIPNPNNYPEVNHKDENVKNCTVDNLEWCTSKYNANYGNRNKKMIEKLSIPIEQYDMSGNFVKTWNSGKEINRNLGFDNSAIARVCKGKQKSCYGYVWKYAPRKVG